MRNYSGLSHAKPQRTQRKSSNTVYKRLHHIDVTDIEIMFLCFSVISVVNCFYIHPFFASSRLCVKIGF